METMNTLLLSGLLGATSATLPAQAPPDAIYETEAMACADAGQPLRLRVSFDAGYENQVQVIDFATRQTLATFSNRPAGTLLGAGAWTLTPTDGCVLISARFTPDDATFHPSSGRFTCTTAGFEDSTDADYNDAALLLEGGHFRGLGDCPGLEQS